MNYDDFNTDIKTLSPEKKKALCKSIRDLILHTCAQNGGHLASNLGIVETTVALHSVFNFPNDKLIFDVGHQCYAHKILTGRADRFFSLRSYGGISGFSDRFESSFDTTSAGHCGSSISAALGIASAAKLSGQDNYTVALVGDGSFTNGMIYEALNNCAECKDLKLIIVLNDNEMSISKNIGGLSRYLLKIRTSRGYFSLKRGTESFLNRLPLIGHGLALIMKHIKDFFKRMLTKSTVFDDLGIKYLGPVDGNDIEKTETLLREAKEISGCCVVHVMTQKGKGYDKAEKHPELYHSVGKFDIDTGVISGTGDTFSKVFGKAICDAASGDDKVCAVTAAMREGTGLSEFAKAFPERMFDVGIAEEHAVAFCGGLSIEGYKPVCAMYSTFSQRVFDQLYQDAALQKAHITLALDPGIVAGDGVMHQGIYDCALFSSIPGIRIYSPETYYELRASLKASFSGDGISVVRYPRGSEPSDAPSNESETEIYSHPNASMTVITYGRISANVRIAVKKLEDDIGIKINLIKLIKVFPLDTDVLLNTCNSSQRIFIIEEGILAGGIAEKLAAFFAENAPGKKVFVRAIENGFLPCGDLNSLFDRCGLSVDKIYGFLREEYK